MSFMKSSSTSPPPIAFRSAPAQKTSPLPVNTATRSSGSSSSWRQARYMPASIPGLSAFFASGRFKVTTSTWPSRSRRQWSGFMGNSYGPSDAGLSTDALRQQACAEEVEDLVDRLSGRLPVAVDQMRGHDAVRVLHWRARVRTRVVEDLRNEAV